MKRKNEKPIKLYAPVLQFMMQALTVYRIKDLITVMGVGRGRKRGPCPPWIFTHDIANVFFNKS